MWAMVAGLIIGSIILLVGIAVGYGMGTSKSSDQDRGSWG